MIYWEIWKLDIIKEIQHTSDDNFKKSSSIHKNEIYCSCRYVLTFKLSNYVSCLNLIFTKMINPRYFIEFKESKVLFFNFWHWTLIHEHFNFHWLFNVISLHNSHLNTSSLYDVSHWNLSLIFVLILFPAKSNSLVKCPLHLNKN